MPHSIVLGQDQRTAWLQQRDGVNALTTTRRAATLLRQAATCQPAVTWHGRRKHGVLIDYSADPDPGSYPYSSLVRT